MGERSSADPCLAARHVIGRLLDLSQVSWQAYVAGLLADHTRLPTKRQLSELGTATWQWPPSWEQACVA
jgi:hypothetical protein